MSAQLLRRNRRNIITAILIMTAICLMNLCPAFAIEPVNKTSDGVAIKGYDPMAYFTDRRPAKGNRKFEYAWMGAKWHFFGPEHRDLFIKNPEEYAPQYGGYCA